MAQHTKAHSLQTQSSLLASLIYLASAGVMLAGIGQVLEPLWAQRDIAGEKFAGVGALHGYELALLLAALVIVLWKRVFEDAVALVLLFVAFLIGAASSLDVIAPDFAEASMLIGVAAFVAAASKLWALQKWLVHPLSAGLWAAFLFLIALNFILPGALGITMSESGGRSAREMIDPWLIGWYITLAATLVPVIAAIRLQPASLQSAEGPLLRQPLLLWYLALIALAGTFFHQAALIWTFNLPMELTIIYPAVSVLAIYVIAFRRALGRNNVYTESGALLVALGSILAITAANQFWVNSPTGLGMINYPLTVALGMALTCAALAWYWNQPRLLGFAAAFACCGALLFGVIPQFAAPEFWNWTIAGLMLLICLAIVGVAFRFYPLVALAFAGYLPLFAVRHDYVVPWTGWMDVHPWLLGAMITGLGWLVLYTFADRGVKDRALMLSAVLLSGSVYAAMLQSQWAAGWQCASLFVFAATAGSAWWTSQRKVAVVGAIPPLLVVAHHAGPHLREMFQKTSDNPGWTLVATSFLLLAIGTLISLTKQYWLQWFSPEDAAEETTDVVPDGESR